MITREQALELIREHVKNENIVKHMLALEAVMGKLHQELRNIGKSDPTSLKLRGASKLGGTEEEWKMAGLLHDGDYCEGVPMEKQGVEITKWARERFDPSSSSGDFGEASIPENVAYAMEAHNWSNTGSEPKTLMDWSIFCADSLTGLIVACALVRPDKKLVSVELSSVMKKFNQPSFASGTRRDDIAMCEEKLGLKLEEFVQIALSAMQKIAGDLGL